jgi:hypothetical protein
LAGPDGLGVTENHTQHGIKLITFFEQIFGALAVFRPSFLAIPYRMPCTIGPRGLHWLWEFARHRAQGNL